MLLLLLSVLDLFDQGKVQSNLMQPTPELGEIFNRYWAKVLALDRRGNMALPFFHLRNESFWDLVPKPGKEEALNVSAQIRSLVQLRESLLGARLEESLYRLLHDAEPRANSAKNSATLVWSRGWQKTRYGDGHVLGVESQPTGNPYPERPIQ